MITLAGSTVAGGPPSISGFPLIDAKASTGNTTEENRTMYSVTGNTSRYVWSSYEIVSEFYVRTFNYYTSFDDRTGNWPNGSVRTDASVGTIITNNTSGSLALATDGNSQYTTCFYGGVTMDNGRTWW